MFESLLASAARTAQRTLSGMADPDNTGEFTLSGATYTGVPNLRVVGMEPGPNGLVRIEELDIVATAEQFDAIPSAAPRKPVTALGRSWWLTKVGPPGVSYTLTCVPA
jgi:hypothetical protein